MLGEIVLFVIKLTTDSLYYLSTPLVAHILVLPNLTSRKKK